MYWVYTIGMWVILAFIVLMVIGAMDEKPNGKKTVTSVIILALFVGAKTQIILNRSNIVGNEYYAKNQSRYEVEILSKNEMSVNFAAPYDDDPDFRTIYYSKDGHDLVIDRDDVYDNYKNYVTAVKVRLSDQNKTAHIVYSYDNNKSEKDDKLTLKK